jgi:hypothetical protein
MLKDLSDGALLPVRMKLQNIAWKGGNDLQQVFSGVAHSLQIFFQLFSVYRQAVGLEQSYPTAGARRSRPGVLLHDAGSDESRHRPWSTTVHA